MTKVICALIIGTALLISGCGSIQKGEDPQEMPDGAWNAADSRMIASDMAQELIVHPWLEQFRQSHLRSPVLILDSFGGINMETETMETFARDITDELLNTGILRLVLPRGDLSAGDVFPVLPITDELAIMAGADYVLKGAVIAATLSIKDQKCVDYQVALRLVDPKTGMGVWQAMRSLRKRL
ncbi:MAG: hypothetical protein U1B83_08050 [Candidatus Cloacimonadaceae bacterium]|nr:hypothetical protein [Actinomycetota bacterium]MDZ4182812.1 hypothetical protein [Candidatus Cloacimonadaceae bacterium]